MHAYAKPDTETEPPRPNASLMAWHFATVFCALSHVASSIVSGSPSFVQTSMQPSPQLFGS